MTPIEQLTQSVTRFTLLDDDFDRIKLKAMDIAMNDITSHGRQALQIYNSTLLGEMAEIALIRLGAKPNEYNRNGFDHTDPKTYMWDVEYDGHRIEVKNIPNRTQYYNMATRQYQKFERAMKYPDTCPTRIIVGYNYSVDLPTPAEPYAAVGWLLNEDFKRFMAPGRIRPSQYQGYYATL